MIVGVGCDPPPPPRVPQIQYATSKGIVPEFEVKRELVFEVLAAANFLAL